MTAPGGMGAAVLAADDDQDGSDLQDPLDVKIGQQGSELVAERLQQVGPKSAIHEIQSSQGLRHPLAAALLPLLDTLGISRLQVG